MEIIVLSLFAAFLLLCLLLNFSILYALLAGLILFTLYALRRGFSLSAVLKMCLSGIKNARNVLSTFLLIGVLTALWRAAGTIPVIICYSAVLIRPSLFLLMTFLLNCGVSLLIGTSFGTAATMGVICATMAATMQLPPALIGGAVLAGAFFGDRCSPVSTSALLVSELTGTNIFDNIRAMLKTALVPFLASCLIYFLIGWFTPHGEATLDLAALFGQEFTLHWLALLPAALILLLSLCRVNVKRAMLASILSAIPLCLFLQGVSLPELAQFTLTGFRAEDAALAKMIDGGGVTSMLKVGAIVCLSSAYSGIFQKTGLLENIQKAILRLGKRITPFGAMLVTAILSSAIACNQTLAILLTHQLCRGAEADPKQIALNLENSVVVIAALIPWSIAAAVPLASVGAPATGVLFAFFLYLLPLWRFLCALLRRRKDAPACSTEQQKNA